MNAFWIILTGSLVAVTCGLLGCFLTLRKIIGLTFTFLFALGVILIAIYADQIDLDQDCVLHGEIAYVPLDVWLTESGTNLGPTAVWILGAVFLLVLAIIITGYKGLFLTTFDPAYALSIGISTTFWHYVLMGAVSLTTVVSFESVGAILVVAFLVGPPSIAYLLTDRLPVMLLLSSIAGILAAIGGYYLAVLIDGSIAGAMTVVLGIEFLIVFLFAPKYGLFKFKTSTRT